MRTHTCVLPQTELLSSLVYLTKTDALIITPLGVTSMDSGFTARLWATLEEGQRLSRPQFLVRRTVNPFSFMLRFHMQC